VVGQFGRKIRARERNRRRHERDHEAQSVLQFRTFREYPPVERSQPGLKEKPAGNAVTSVETEPDRQF